MDGFDYDFDFGEGGAFPEILMPQFPLQMGKKNSKSGPNILALRVDSEGNVGFDAVVRQQGNATKIVYSQHKDLEPGITKDGFYESDVDDEDRQREIEDTMVATKAALDEIVNANVTRPKNVSKFVKYQSSRQSAAFNSGAKERVIRLMETVVDPLELPKFKHKKVPKGSGSPPVPVLHSPPRPVTVTDQQEWKIPPCVSNWKNSKGYTIPLDKRLSADGRSYQEVWINDNFAKISEALCVAEQEAREFVSLRSKIQKEMVRKGKDKRDRELQELAQKARSEATRFVGDKMRVKSEKKRLQRRNESAGMKVKKTRDMDRDISEKVALGMASVGSGKGEVMYDQMLFNQEKGMDSGFATDDRYNVYDKGLCTAQATLSTLYQPKKDVDADMYGGAEEQLKNIKNTKRFKPDRAFTGTSEKDGPRLSLNEEADPFELDQFFQPLIEVKKNEKNIDKVAGGGTMRGSGNSSREGYEGASKRRRINFQRGN